MPRKSPRTQRGMAARTSGHNESFWVADTFPIQFAPLERNEDVDVVIVGGGIAGLSVAYFLAREGQNVAVVEDGFIGSGETGRTTAHFTYALDNRYYTIEKRHGRKGAMAAALSHRAAIDATEEIIKREGIACQWERIPGYLFLHPTDSRENLEKERDTLYKLGMTEVSLLTKDMGYPLYDGPYLVFPKQGQLHPMKYLAGLARAITQYGGMIYTQTHAEKITSDGIISRDGNIIRAKHVVVATNSPVNTRLKIHTTQAAYRTYVIAGRIPKKAVEKGLFWDTGNQEMIPFPPYHYVRTHPLNAHSDLLIVGGEDHKTGQGSGDHLRFESLETWTRTRFPFFGKIEYEWSGQVMEPVDAMAYIGRYSPHEKNMYMVTGDSGNGMTHGTMAGMIIRDLIMGRENAWAEFYDPSRNVIGSLPAFVDENMNVATQYADWLKAEKKDVKKLKNGEGMILNQGMETLAVYQDETGKTHVHSAVCPHLGCKVKWNAVEKTFDCPCHGSRFTGKGKVINGPANVDLETKSVPIPRTKHSPKEPFPTSPGMKV